MKYKEKLLVCTMKLWVNIFGLKNISPVTLQNKSLFFV